MENDLVNSFANELKSINNAKPPVSRTKIQDISKAALKAKDEYKHVVHAVEKFLLRCKIDHKITVAYIIDSIIRAGKHQLKEKDVFAKRFLGVFPRIMPMLLDCNPVEQLRIVRTMNLWVGSGIYTEQELAQVKEDIRAKGIVTDPAEVERLVKGEQANMNLYKPGSSKERHHKSNSHRENPQFEAQTPPGPPPAHLLKEYGLVDFEQSTNLTREDLSDDVPEGGISEREFLRILTENNVDFGGSFSSDISLLKRAHNLMCDRLCSHEEERKKNHSQSIKKLLQYDYSDDEDDKKEDEDPYIPLTLEERTRVASNLLNTQQVQDALMLIHKERIDGLNQIANQAKQKNLADSGLLMPASQMPSFPFQGQLGLPFQDQFSLQFPDHMGIPPPMPNLQGFQGNFQIPPPGSQGLPQSMNFSLPPSLQNVGRSGATGPSNLLNSFLPQNPLMNLGSLPLQPNFTTLPPTQPLLNMLGNGMDFQHHQDFLQGPMFLGQSLGVPPPNMNPSNMNTMPNKLQFQQRPFPTVSTPDEDLRMPPQDQPTTSSERQKRRRSRSRERERGEHKRSRRSRSRENSKRQSESDEQKKKRKSGFPTDVLPETTNVVSRTLWFGRLPSNCTERDIQEAVKGCGTTTNVNIIPSKACAYVVMDSRKSAYDIIKMKNQKPMKIREREIKISYSLPSSITNEEDKATWDQEKGHLFCAWSRLPQTPHISNYFDGAQIDVSTLPPQLQGVIDEYARPIEMHDDKSMLMATEGDMEMSPMAPEMAPLPNFNAFQNVMGLQQPLSTQSLMGNPLLLPQQHALHGGINPSLLQVMNPPLPPSMMQHGGLMGMQPTSVPGPAPVPLMQHPAAPPQYSGISISSLGTTQQQHRGPPPQSFDNPNREPLGHFRGGFRGGMRGRGSFRGDRGGPRNNNSWNDRPPRDDFRHQPDNRRDRPDFRRNDRESFGRRGGGADWEQKDTRRDEGRDERGGSRGNNSWTDRSSRDSSDRRREGGRRRESRWESQDSVKEQDDFIQRQTSDVQPQSYNDPMVPGLNPNDSSKSMLPAYLPPSNPTLDDFVVSSTTTEFEPQTSYNEEQPLAQSKDNN